MSITAISEKSIEQGRHQSIYNTYQHIPEILKQNTSYRHTSSLLMKLQLNSILFLFATHIYCLYNIKL